MRAGALACCRAASASGFSEASSSRAATALVAASISAIWVGNMSRNRPEMRQVTSTRGRPSDRRRQHLDAGDAAGRGVPLRPAAHQRKSLSDFLAAGAQRGRAPEVDHQRARPVAMVLHVAPQHFGSSGFADVEGGRRRHGARVGGEEVAAGRQDIDPCGPAPARRTDRPSHADRRARRSAPRARPRRSPCGSASSFGSARP